MHHRQRHLLILITVLITLGLGIFSYRHFVLDVPLKDNETINSWTVDANLRFIAERSAPIKAGFTIPYSPPNFAILDEYFVSRNYGVSTSLKNSNRHTIWSIRRASGQQSLFYRAIFRQGMNQDNRLPAPAAEKPQPLPEHLQSPVGTLIEQIRQSSADIQTFAQTCIKELLKRDDNARLILDGQFNDDQMIKAASLILNQARIASMPVMGIYLNQNQNRAEFKKMIAVYTDSEWVYINPKNGTAGLPKDFLIWQYGDAPVYELSGGRKPSFNVTVTATPINALTIAKTRGTVTDSQLLRFSLLQLPSSTQETYKILLMVPIGAFVILILRNFIGLKTFGTFMPVLIALAFRETQLLGGLFLFSFIVAVGLLVRFYLDQLRLLLVPRLASVLTVVILLMIFLSIMGQTLGFDMGLSVALFPMVILTMTIERMCIVWDERGAAESIKSGVGSLAAAVVCYLVMSIQSLQYLMFAFPELLLVLLGIILLFGQYKGYRLTELMRFKALARS